MTPTKGALTGQTALVTGGAYGIGSAIASRFADEGAQVAILGRNPKTLTERAKAIVAQGGRCVWRACDVTDWSAVEGAIDDLAKELGSIGILVNNAGGWMGDTVEEADADRLTSLIQTILLGTFLSSKAALPHMKGSRTAFILNIGSTSGLPGSADSAVASAPKAAIALFTHTLAREVASDHIRVSVLHPARVNRKSSREEGEQQDENGQYKSLSPQQVADVALFVVTQPENVAIRELVVTPTDVTMS